MGFEQAMAAFRIELVPRRSMEEARGFLKGLSTTIEREADRV